MAPVLAVADVVESIRFYRDVVGFEVVSVEDDVEDVDFAILRLGGIELMLTFADSGADRDDESDEGEVDEHDGSAAGQRDGEALSGGDEGAGGIGIGAGAGIGLVFTCDDVDVAFAFLRERGGDVEPPIVSDFGVRQVYLMDPDGYQSCFQAAAEG